MNWVVGEVPLSTFSICNLWGYSAHHVVADTENIEVVSDFDMAQNLLCEDVFDVGRVIERLQLLGFFSAAHSAKCEDSISLF